MKNLVGLGANKSNENNNGYILLFAACEKEHNCRVKYLV